MSVLNHLNTQLNSLLEMEELYLESSESIEILIEKSFSAVERIISTGIDEVAHEEVNDIARNTILICTFSYKVVTWLPELSLNTWRRYISYLKEFSHIISENIVNEMWQCLVKYFQEEINYLRQLYEHRSMNGANDSNDEVIANSIKLLFYLAQRLSASIFFFSTRFPSVYCAQSIYLLCDFHSLLRDQDGSHPHTHALTRTEPTSIQEKSRLNFHKAFCASTTSTSSEGGGEEGSYQAVKSRYLQLLSALRDTRACATIPGTIHGTTTIPGRVHGAIALAESELEMVLHEASHHHHHQHHNGSSIVGCFIVCMEVFVTALAHLCVFEPGQQISDSFVRESIARLASHVQASAIAFGAQSWGTILGVVVSQSLCGGAVRHPNPHSFGTAQRSVSVIYSCVLCLCASLQEQRSKEAIVEMAWTRFKQIHLTSRTTAGFDSRYVLAVQAVRRTIMAAQLPGVPSFITEPFLSTHERCSHRQELFCACNGRINANATAAVEVLFTYMPVDCMDLPAQFLDRHIERCLRCIEQTSNPGAVSSKSVGLALSFLFSVVRYPPASPPTSATAQLVSKYKAAYLGHVGIATNILNWMKVLGDYIRKASRGTTTTTTTTTTTSGYRHARHNGSGGDNDNNFHAVGVYRLLRMQNVISVIGKLSLMLGPRKKVPAGVQSVLLDISLSLVGFLTALVDTIRDDYVALQKRRNSSVGVTHRELNGEQQTACMWEGLRETVLVSCDVALTCAESVKNILSIGFAGISSASPVTICERFFRVVEALVAACGVSGAPANLTWRLWSITIEAGYASKSYLRADHRAKIFPASEASAQVSLSLLLKICDDRDNHLHTHIRNDLAATIPTIIDHLDLLTL